MIRDDLPRIRITDEADEDTIVNDPLTWNQVKWDMFAEHRESLRAARKRNDNRFTDKEIYDKAEAYACECCRLAIRMESG